MVEYLDEFFWFDYYTVGISDESGLWLLSAVDDPRCFNVFLDIFYGFDFKIYVLV